MAYPRVKAKISSVVIFSVAFRRIRLIRSRLRLDGDPNFLQDDCVACDLEFHFRIGKESRLFSNFNGDSDLAFRCNTHSQSPFLLLLVLFLLLFLKKSTRICLTFPI